MKGRDQPVLQKCHCLSTSWWTGSWDRHKWLGKEHFHKAHPQRSPEKKSAALTSRRNFKNQGTNSVKTFLRTKKRPWTTVIRKKTSGAPLWFSTLVIGQKQSISFFFQKQQIIANPLLHTTYNLSPHQWLLEPDRIKHSSQAFLLKAIITLLLQYTIKI